jgi:hypothetical protein
MTEAEWLTCRDPKAMIEFVRQTGSDRKKLLFAVACVQTVKFLTSTPKDVELVAQVALLLDIFGNPFSPVAFSLYWHTSTVLSLVQGIYDECAFDRMPILADALQDAGCGNEEILSHCRGIGSHCRGCWVVDLVLGKA